MVAEATRFVRVGNLITAEVTLRNTGSVPARVYCYDWQLIDEQTSRTSQPVIEGGKRYYDPETLAPGTTHVTWAKFKAEASDLSGGNYSVNIESILNRPFEGLTLTEAAPQPTQQESRVAGVLAELTRFERVGNLITADVTLRNTGSVPARVYCYGWQLIDEQTSRTSQPVIEGGKRYYDPETLAPGTTHMIWAKFKGEASDLSGGSTW